MNFRDVLVAEKWTVRMPEDRVVSWDWGKWERGRFDSMALNLQPGDVLYDVGTEWGEISAAYAQIVGARNLVLMEPHPETWTIIKRVWEENKLEPPRACWVGLVGDEDGGEVVPMHGPWPAPAYGPLWPHRSYRYIHEHLHHTPIVSVAQFAYRTGIRPTAVTIDVEGAELDVLRGMRLDAMDGTRPLIWCSVHPDLLEKFYGQRREVLFNYMQAQSYRSRLLWLDHEEHWLFWPEEREEPK